MNIDLNCDLGESFGRYELGEDEAVMTSITSVNIACGMHAGDPLVIDRTLRLAVSRCLAVGAHPGYPDLQGFGRREMTLSPGEVEAYILYQVGAVWGFARSAGVDLVHVKPHGALYNQAAKDLKLAQAVARGVKRFSSTLTLVGLAGSALVAAGRELGLRVANEGFPDRAYQSDGSLMPRSQPGAVLGSDEAVCAHALTLAQNGIQVEMNGEKRRIAVDTLCIHGDHPGAAQRAAAVRAALEAGGLRVRSLAG